MKAIIVGLTAFWTLLSVAAHFWILPADGRDDDLLIALSEAAAEAADGPCNPALGRLLESWPSALVPLSGGAIDEMAIDDRRRYLDRVEAWWAGATGSRPEAVATLSWSTDDNPARRAQTHMFRVWHLLNHGELIDLVTDPSNRDITKTIVQCIAGAGPDIIEASGPSELAQFVDAGVALDVTDRARDRGFGLEAIFPVVETSVARHGRQFAFPCNLHYIVLFYHRDVFEQLGLPDPGSYSQGWTIDQAVEAGLAVQEAARAEGTRRFGMMGLNVKLLLSGAGVRYFDDSGTDSIFDSPQTVAVLQQYVDLMRLHRVMPTPGEAASMASSGGAVMHADVQTANASSLFGAKASAMVADGRWSYALLAARNRDRVLIPAMRGRLDQLDGASGVQAERSLLLATISALEADVLSRLSDDQYAAMVDCLDDEDRGRLLNVGIAHLPTTDGRPRYETSARVAIVNRKSENSEYAQRFLEFLSSSQYNEQINGSFDSICGVPAFCFDANGVSGAPRALPGLEAFDSPIFSRAVQDFATPWETSPFVGRTRMSTLIDPVFERLTNGLISPAEAARLVEQRLDTQIRAAARRDADLERLWIDLTGTPVPDA